MKKALVTFIALATIIIGVSSPAAASSASEFTIQVHSSWHDHGRYHHHGWRKRPYKYRHQIMNPGEIKRILHRRGYRTHNIRQQRGEYYVRARNFNGRQVMLIVNAYNGKIVGQRYIGRPHFNRS